MKAIFEQTNRAGKKFSPLHISIITLYFIGVLAVFHGLDSRLRTQGKDHYDDIFYNYSEGVKIAEGVNPYERILSGNIRENHKYPTYLPGSYLGIALFHVLLGEKEYAEWYTSWRQVCFLFHLGCGIVLFLFVYESTNLALSIFASAFGLFNRWSLMVLNDALLEPAALFFLLLSLFYFKKKKYFSFICLGLSLAIKQVSVCLVPVYLIWAWNDGEKENAARRCLYCLITIGLIPFTLSLPFIVSGPESFFKCIMFSLTRNPAGDIASLDVVFDLVGLPAKLPMLGLVILIYWCSWKRWLDIGTTVFAIIFTWVGFNSVVFPQYVAWAMPLFGIALCEAVSPKTN